MSRYKTFTTSRNPIQDNSKRVLVIDRQKENPKFSVELEYAGKYHENEPMNDQAMMDWNADKGVLSFGTDPTAFESKEDTMIPLDWNETGKLDEVLNKYKENNIKIGYGNHLHLSRSNFVSPAALHKFLILTTDKLDETGHRDPNEPLNSFWNTYYSGNTKISKKPVQPNINNILQGPEEPYGQAEAMDGLELLGDPKNKKIYINNLHSKTIEYRRFQNIHTLMDKYGTIANHINLMKNLTDYVNSPDAPTLEEIKANPMLHIIRAVDYRNPLMNEHFRNKKSIGGPQPEDSTTISAPSMKPNFEIE